MRSFLKSALLVSPPFVLGLGALVLDRFRVLELDRRIAPPGALVLNLALYWALAAALVASVRERAAVGAFLRARRAPLLALAISLALALALAEIAVQRLGIAERPQGFRLIDSETFHHVNPSGLALVDGTGAFVRTNAEGFRTEYTRERFLRFGARIAVLGDSYAFGLGVNGEETACAVLEHTLRTRLSRQDLGVLDTGVISYSPLLERTAFREKVRAYEPTLVLLFLDGNDIGDDYRYGEQNVSTDPERPRFEVPEKRTPPALLLLAKPALRVLAAPCQVLGRFFPGLRGGGDTGDGDYYDFRLEIGGVVETNRWFILRHPLELTRPFFEKTLSYVEEIAQDARASGAAFALFVLPRYFHWSDKECPDDWAGDQHAYDEPHEFAMFDFFAEQAGSADFPIVSLLPAFQASTVFPLCFENDPHWKPAGHQLVGEAVADELLARGLVK